MINEILAFVVMGGVCSLVVYMLNNKATPSRRPWRQNTGDGSSIGPGDSSSGNGSSLFSWLGGDSSSQDSNSSGDFGGGDGGGGGGD